jgi:methyl-accepting chemotaxis protein
VIGEEVRAVVETICEAAAAAEAQAEAGRAVTAGLESINAAVAVLAEGARAILLSAMEAETAACEAQRAAEQVAGAAEEQASAAAEAQQAIGQQSQALDQSQGAGQLLAGLSAKLQTEGTALPVPRRQSRLPSAVQRSGRPRRKGQVSFDLPET